MSKKYTGIKSILLSMCLLISAFYFNACQNDDDVAAKVTQLKSFGPSPALRGGDIVFIGTGLDKISSITMPGGIEVSTFKTKTPEMIIIEVPEETVEGTIVLRGPSGDIETKTILGILEPIVIAPIPAKARPGDVITITGDYLNLINEIIFKNNIAVTEFESHSRTKIEVKVPANAQTGLLIFSTGEKEPLIPVLIESKTELEVALPVATQISPNPVKVGEPLTITGADLDLTSKVIFGGEREVTTFISKTSTELIVNVPTNAQAGKIKLMAASFVSTESSQALTLVSPAVASVSPTSVKNGGTITVTGTNLDLVSKVVFTGGLEGPIKSGRSATQFIVDIPARAKSGTVTFSTNSNTSVMSSESLTMVKPAINSISPQTIETNSDITITGTNLDIVDSIMFKGNKVAKVTGASATQIVIKVPFSSESGKITLIANNGDMVESSESLTISKNVPLISSVPATANLGKMMTITGTKLNLFSEIIFPTNIKATLFGVKTATTIEVFVPATAKTGVGKLIFITKDGEVTESPEINFAGIEPLKKAFYSDVLENGWQKWGGWGGTSDINSTEQALVGSKSIKATYTGNWSGAIQLGGGNTSTAATTEFTVSIFGGPGTNGKKMDVFVRGGSKDTNQITLVEGEWKEFKFSLADFGNPASINEFYLKNHEWLGTIYVDHIGLR